MLQFIEAYHHDWFDIETQNTRERGFLHKCSKVIFSFRIAGFNKTVYAICPSIEMGEQGFQFRMLWTAAIPKNSLILFSLSSSTCVFATVLCKWCSLDMRIQRWVFLRRFSLSIEHEAYIPTLDKNFIPVHHKLLL